ncbi:cytochrome P450 [Actinomadura welshii]
MSATEELPVIGHGEEAIFGVSAELRALQAEGPCIRVRTPAGDAAWLVTRHREARKLLRDRRLGRSHPDPENAPRYFDNPMLDMLRNATDFANEHEIHYEMRALLSPYFSGRHITALESWMAEIIDDWVDVLAGKRPPIDMQAEFAQPMAMQMICELLGVPVDERTSFRALVHQVSGVADADDAMQGRNGLFEYFTGLVARRREAPGEDVLSGIVEAGLDDVQAASMGLMLLFAAYGSTSSQTSQGIIRLATDTRLRDELVRDPDLMPGAVEEFLRSNNSGGFTLPHYAREDIEVGDVTVRKGDLVLIDYALVNFDGDAFPDPNRVDIGRHPNPHVTFAHGLWHCIGAPLARAQLRISFNALLARFPAMRLAVPVAELSRSATQLGGEVDDLLVTW